MWAAPMPANSNHSRRRSHPRILVAVAVLLACVLWVLAPQVPKGVVLYKFTPDHGIDSSDLVTIPFLALVAWLLWPGYRRARLTPMLPFADDHDGSNASPPSRGPAS